MDEQSYGYHEVQGNIFNSSARALVNTVNCVGAMGKGIALEFRRRYPNMFAAYAEACQRNELKPGVVYYSHADTEDLQILNFAIKSHWRFPSKIQWIEACLRQFVSEYRVHGIESVAFPWMGAMNGGLPLDLIQTTMRRHLQMLPNITIEVYHFDGNATDPLFETLKEIIAVEPIRTIARSSGVSERTCQIIASLVTDQHIPSLYRLINSEGIGETSINRLYCYLSQERHARTSKLLSPHLTQLPLL